MEFRDSQQKGLLRQEDTTKNINLNNTRYLEKKNDVIVTFLLIINI